MSKITTAILGILKSPQGVFNLVKDRISIGRNKASTIPISHPSISKDHALIEFDNEQIATLKDLNSSNGTFINNNRLQSNPIQLKTNDKISFGKDPTVYIFESFNQDNEKTIVYSTTIHDEKISLVNDENYQSSRINHFQNKNRLSMNNNQYDSAKYTTRNPISNTFTDDGLADSNITFKNKSNEDLVYQLQKMSVEKEEIATKSLEFEKKFSEKCNELKKMTDLFDQLSEEYSKLNAKHNALMLFASDLQKKVDLYEIEINEMNENEKNKDISKILSEKDNIITILQNEANYYKDQIQKVKGNISPMVPYSNREEQFSATGYINTQLMAKLDDLIESYIKENRELKSVNGKLKDSNIENTLQNEVNQRNQRDNDMKYFQDQMNNQIANLNSIISDYDSRLLNAIDQLPGLFEDEKKETAAKYLVEQVNSFMEDNRRLQNENAFYNNKIVEMQNELSFMRQSQEKLKEQVIKSDHNTDEMKHLNTRIEELENVITKFKNDKNRGSFQQSPRVDPNNSLMPFNPLASNYSYQQGSQHDPGMKDCLLNALNQLRDKEKAIDDLKSKLKNTISNTSMNFDDRQIVSSVSETLRERDSMIMNLQNQLRLPKSYPGTQYIGQDAQSKFEELKMGRDELVSSLTQAQ